MCSEWFNSCELEGVVCLIAVFDGVTFAEVIVQLGILVVKILEYRCICCISMLILFGSFGSLCFKCVLLLQCLCID